MSASKRPASSSSSLVPSPSRAQVAQVVASMGDTVLDVHEVGRTPRRRPRGLAWMGAGLAMVLGGAGLLAYEVSADWEGYRTDLARAQMEEARLPAIPGLGTGSLGFVLALLGLAPLGLGLRGLHDRPRAAFTIGEGPGVSLQVPGDALPRRDAFTLIERRGDALVVRFGGAMEGEVVHEGARVSFAALAASGACEEVQGVHAIRLIDGATASLRIHDLHLDVAATEAVALEVGRPAVDRPIWWSTAAAALVLGVPLAACHAVDPGVDYRDHESIASSRIYQYIHAPDPQEEEEEPPPADASENSADEAGGVAHRHKGEEGRMGKPTSKNKSGLYAMKGPRDAVPQMARSFDPGMASRSAGILGTMSQGSGSYLASPYGGAYAVGNDDGDVWGGLSPQGAFGVGGLGLVGAGPAGADERYAPIVERGWARVTQEPLSTFSIDVDTAAYANVRRFLRDGALPPADAVRVEEMINYFDYAYPEPAGQHPLAVSAEVASSPWNPEHRLVRVGMKALELDPQALPPRNLVFLVDTSGSMNGEGKLGLVVDGLKMLADDLRPVDRIAVVTYAGSSGVVLEPTPGSQREAIKGALSNLRAGGGTNGAAGIWLAYRLAHKHFQEGAINRVILATDGDFNVGVSGHDELIKVIERERETGVFLSVLAVGTGNLNDRTMEQIADHGNGNYSYLDSREEARKVLVEQSAGTLATVAKDVKIQVEFNPAKVAAYRLVGYENRALAAEDFVDDRKDAGELGVGHTVTALYEVVPAGKAVPGAVDPLRYQRPRAELVESDEMLTVKVRYKLPEAESSVPFEVPVIDRGAGLGDASPQLRLAAAIAGFGLALRGSERLGEWGLDEAAALLDGVDVADPRGRIAELRDLIQVARRLQGRQAAR